jgi:hypothetical protein
MSFRLFSMGGWLLCSGKHKINFLMEFLKSPHCHPHFTTEPLYKGFGNFVDQYFDLEENEQFKINTKAEFIEKFNLSQEDKYKLIINALIER